MSVLLGLSDRPTWRRVKAAMLTNGCTLTDTVDLSTLDEHNRRLLEDGSFVHGVVLRVGRTMVNTSVGIQTRSPDPYAVALIQQDGRLYAEFEGTRAPISFLPQPEALRERLEGQLIGDFLSLHSPSTVFSTPTRQCLFIAAAEPCLFCTYETGRVQTLPRPLHAAMLRRVLADATHAGSLAIGGGTTSLQDGGARYYGGLVEDAHAMGLDTSLEIIPPRELSVIDGLRDQGLDSLIMNLELWDDNIRKRICLGKGKIAKTHYLKSYQKAVEVFGAGAVTSVLLVGLEPMASTMEGVRHMVDIGVIPILIPYRRYAGSTVNRVENITPDSYLEIESAASDYLASAGLAAASQKGCVSCGGCSLANDWH